MPKMKISPELLSTLLRYEPETGRLFWKERTPDAFVSGKQSCENICAAWNGRLAGKEAFNSINGCGYRCSSIFGVGYRASRVVWAMETGTWPKDQIDHINGMRSDDRFVNLREVSNQENSRNQKLRCTNKSGVAGVGWCKKMKKWTAKIMVDSKQIHLGMFWEKKDAISARNAAEIEHGFHPSHGRK